MKIYCNQEQPKLEDFLGTDIWVKCRSTWGTFAEQDVYINVIDTFLNETYQELWVRYCACPDFTVEDFDLGMLSVQETMEEIEYEYTAPIDTFIICQPLMICTTQDIVEIAQASDEPRLN